MKGSGDLIDYMFVSIPPYFYLWMGSQRSSHHFSPLLLLLLLLWHKLCTLFLGGSLLWPPPSAGRHWELFYHSPQMNSGTRECLYGGPVKSRNPIFQVYHRKRSNLFKIYYSKNSSHVFIAFLYSCRGLATSGSSLWYSIWMLIALISYQGNNWGCWKMSSAFLSPSDMGFEKAHKLPWSFEIAGDRSCTLTTFIMANSCFCIVAESMDKIIAPTRTALSELAIWPNLS